MNLLRRWLTPDVAALERRMHEMELAFSEWELVQQGTLEKLRTWSARQAKQRSREVGEHLAESPPDPSQLELSGEDAKMAYRRRVFGGRSTP